METAVVDEDMIVAALLEEAGDDQLLNSMATFELAQMVAQATTLRLSYKNILKIENLQGFGKLTKLCLDNNVIEHIGNLGHLVNLQWLDLSFNNIRKIEGLSSLTHLTDLSLYRNRISEIDGLDSCKELQCLSLGRNHIQTLDNIIKLRQFPSLQLVNLEGNPVCKEAEYKFIVLAYLRNLKFHDYSMVDPAEVVQAREQYQDELLDVQEKEALEVERQAREAAVSKEEADLDRANILVVKTLFSEMFAADTEMTKLRHLPGIEEIIEQFKTHVMAAADALRVSGLERAALKAEQVRLYSAACEALRQDYSKRSIVMVEDFNRKKKRVFRDLGTREAIEASDLGELRADLDKLETSLMDLEMYQVEQQDELLAEFEVKFGELRQQCLELLQNFFRACEAHEESYFSSLGQLAQDMLDKASKNELHDDISDELGNLLIDRDTCITSVVSSHEIHVGQLLGREDETRAAEMKRMAEAVEGFAQAEIDRNRARIMELREFFTSNRRHISDLLSSKQLDDFEDGEG